MGVPGSPSDGHADRHPHVARLRIGSILGGAVRLYRLQPGRVAVASLVVLLPLVLVSQGIHALEEALRPHDSGAAVYLVALLPSMAEILALLGLVVLGGVMDELVGSSIRGTPTPSLAEAIRSLPYGSLIAADLLVTAIVGVGALFGAIPGLLAASFVLIVGPVVNIERHGPASAIRRAFHLTWPHAWLAIGITFPSILLEAVAHGVLLRVWGDLGLVGVLGVEIVLILTVGAFVVLAEVVLAYALMARDPGSPVELMVRRAVEVEDPAVARREDPRETA